MWQTSMLPAQAQAYVAQVATGTGMQMGVLAVSGAGMGPSRHTMALSAEFSLAGACSFP